MTNQVSPQSFDALAVGRSTSDPFITQFADETLLPPTQGTQVLYMVVEVAAQLHQEVVLNWPVVRVQLGS
jgi:hypothetical protein